MSRLNQNLLSQLPKDVALPQYDRSQLVPGIVHLGIGAFHRAHQAFYTEAVLNQFGVNWGIIGCSLRSAGVRDQLVPQDCLYTLVERSGDGEKLQIIGAVKDTLVGPETRPHWLPQWPRPISKLSRSRLPKKAIAMIPPAAI
jgi:fructuronate reductase